MKETEFIKNNTEKWSKFEKALESSKDNPEQLSKLYIDITEDLGYAQTFYNRRTVRVYLNQLAQKVFSGVHKQGGESFRKIIHAATVSVPIEVYRSRKTLLFALVMFCCYALVGVISTYYNPDFPRIILGDYYVDMTIENIANGNPLDVYASQEHLSMFIHITSNNLKVAFLTFFAGFFFTLGAHLLMFSNGVMLGSFQYFFYTKGLLITSFLGIWIHGAFEISAIVLAGGAGIVAGRGLLFPGSFTRIQSLKIATRRGFKIMLSLVPFIIIAGFLESYVTRNYQLLPAWSKWFIILFSFAFIVAYYVIYPFYISRKYPDLLNQEPAIHEQPVTPVKLYQNRNEGQTIIDSFVIYRIYFAKFFKAILTLVFPVALLLIFIQGREHYDDMLVQHWYDWYGQAEIMFGYGLENLLDLFIGFCWSILVVVVFAIVFWTLKFDQAQFEYRLFFQYLKNRFIKMYLAFAVFYFLFFFTPIYLKFLLLFILPFFATNIAVAGLDEGENLLKKSYRMGRKKYASNLIYILFFSLLVTLLIQPIALVFSIHNGWTNEPVIRDVLDMICDFANRVFLFFTEDYMYFSNSIRQLFYLLFVLLTLPFFAIILALSYFNLKEKYELISLKKEFELFGKRKKYQE